MKRKFLLITSVALLASSALSASPRQFNTAHCSDVRSTGKCSLAWDFSAAPRMRYMVERLNPDNGQWQVIQTKIATHLGASRMLGGGHLYRVRACNGAARNEPVDCRSSEVVWAPEYPPEHEIPSEIVDSHGQTMTVDKSAPYEEQLEQYNVYLLVRQVGSQSVNLAELPSMDGITEEEIWADGEWSAAEAMQRSIFLNYSGMQEIAKSNAAQGDATRR